MYNKIYNPVDKKFYNIQTKKGKSILKKYLLHNNGSGNVKANKKTAVKGTISLHELNLRDFKNLQLMYTNLTKDLKKRIEKKINKKMTQSDIYNKYISYMNYLNLTPILNKNDFKKLQDKQCFSIDLYKPIYNNIVDFMSLLDSINNEATFSKKKPNLLNKMNKIISMIEDLAATIIKSYDMKGGDPLIKDGAVGCMGNSTETHNRIDPITNEVIREEYYIDPIDYDVIQIENYLQEPINKGCYTTSNLCDWLQRQADSYRPLTTPLSREHITDDWFVANCPNATLPVPRPHPTTGTDDSFYTDHGLVMPSFSSELLGGILWSGVFSSYICWTSGATAEFTAIYNTIGFAYVFYNVVQNRREMRRLGYRES